MRTTMLLKRKPQQSCQKGRGLPAEERQPLRLVAQPQSRVAKKDEDFQQK